MKISRFGILAILGSSLFLLASRVPAQGGADSDGGYGLREYGSNDLWMEITLTNAAASFSLHAPDPNGIFDLLATTNLNSNVDGLNLTNWLWLTRTTAGQTNIVLTILWPSASFFILGTMLDSDGDGFTDAYERLVSHSDPGVPYNPDTDGDGLSNWYELNVSHTDPFTPQPIPTLSGLAINKCPVP